MDSRPLQHGQIIAGFNGENTVLSELVLPPTVSPDARNIDYKDGTIKKRKGWSRVLPHILRLGSLYCKGANGMSHTNVASYNFAGSFRIDFLINVNLFSSTGNQILEATNGTTGFYIYLDGSGTIGLLLRDGGAVARNVSINAAASQNQTYAVSAGLNTGTNQIFITVNGVTSTAACTGYTVSTAASWQWSANTDGLWFIDEIRIWDAIPASPTYDIDTTRSGINAAAPNLVGYYKFDGATAGTDSSATANTGTVYARSVDLSALSGATYSASLTGIHPVYNAGSYSRVLLTNQSVIAIYTYGSNQITFLSATSTSSTNRWTDDSLNSIMVLVNGASTNMRYDATNGLAVLTPSNWSNTGVSAADSGAGASPPSGGAGVYSYLIRWRNSATGDEGGSAAPLTATSVGNSITITGVPTSTELGVDKWRIYRTAVGGSTYYYLTDVNNGTSSYDDDGTPALSSTLYDERYGKAPVATCVSNFNNMILLGAGSTVYASEIGSTGRHYAFNTIVLGNGDGGQITASIAASGVCVFFKTNGIYAVNGYAPRSLSAQKLFAGQGAVHASAVCASDEAIYYLTRTGVCRLALPVGSAAPVEITEQTHRSLFGNFTDDNRQQCAIGFDLRNRLLYVSFVTANGPDCLIYSEQRQIWSRHEIPADTFRYFPLKGGVSEMFMGWQGYWCRLDSGNNAGIDVGRTPASTSAYTVKGTVSNATTNSVKDTTASFPTDGNGLAGCTVTLVDPTTGVYTDYVIASNTPTVLTTAGGSPTTTVGQTYYLGRIDGYWQGPRMILDGKGDGKTSVHRINVWQRPQATVSPQPTVSVTTEYDDDGTTNTKTIPTSTTFSQELPTNSGHRLSLLFQNKNPNERFEVEGFQVMLREGSTR